MIAVVSWIGRGLRRISIDQWRAIDAQLAADGERQHGLDWRAIVVLVTACVVLTLQEYLGNHDVYRLVHPPHAGDKYWSLGGFAWWSAWRVGGYLLIPALVVLLMPGERVRDYHVSPLGFFHHLWIYALLFSLILPGVILASRTQSFYQTYPFYKWANRSRFDLVTWEALYAAQFVALEFFFRGFLLRGLRRVFGANAIFVMIVPYCMIHYQKPMPETFGAIGAGIILGTLAMRTRSIWGGVVIHIAVATTMDVLALGHCPPASMHRPCVGD